MTVYSLPLNRCTFGQGPVVIGGPQFESLLLAWRGDRLLPSGDANLELNIVAIWHVYDAVVKDYPIEHHKWLKVFLGSVIRRPVPLRRFSRYGPMPGSLCKAVRMLSVNSVCKQGVAA
jgi:hypothetical protein